MLYSEMTKEQKMKVVDEFISICEKSTETEIKKMYQNDSSFKKRYQIVQKYVVEYFVEPIIEVLKELFQTIERIKEELAASYLQAIQANSLSMPMAQTMSLGC